MVLRTRRQVRQAERKWRHTRLHVHRQIYTDLRDAFKETIAHAKSTYYCGEIASYSKYSKRMFAVAKDLMGCSKKPSLPKIDSCPVALSERFAAYFKGKITRLSGNQVMTQTQPRPPRSNDSDCCLVTESLRGYELATVAEIRKSCLSTGSKLSPRIDILTGALLKCSVYILAPVLTRIVNSSLASSTVPAAMKHAVITPLLKKAGLDADNLASYRPISQLSFVSKLLEKHVAIQIRQHMEFNDLFDTFQSAYRSAHSCETAMVHIQDDILKALDCGKHIILVLLDLSAAFDSVDHAILIDKLHMIGVRGDALCWVESYLSARTQVIRIGEATSQPIHLSCGVPQGSVLGPLLFNIYCHDLGSVFAKHGVHYHMYADDTQLYVEVPRDNPERATDSLSCCIQDVKKWMTLNKLTLNCIKTEVIAITTATTRHLRPIVVHVDNEALRPKPYVRDIGIVLDDTMNMDWHVSHTCRLAYHHLRSIAKVRNSLTMTACKTMVLSLVISRLDFGNATLYGISETLLHRLQVVQNSAARLIMRVRKREHITPILFALHWLPVRQRIQYKILTLVYRCLNQQAPAYLSTCITPYVPGRSLRSSDHGLLTEHRYRLERYGRRCFTVAGPALWNELPTPVKDCQSYPSFKATLKTHLFRQAFRDLV